MGLWQIKGKGWRYRFEHRGQTYSGQWYETKGAARTAREAHRQRVKSPPSSGSAPPVWEFASLMIDYLEEARRRFQPKTWKYKRYVYQCFLAFAGNLPLAQISEHLVGRYLLTRPSNYNYNFHRKDLHALFRWAQDRGLMAHNPCARLTPLSLPAPRLIHLSEDDWSRFLLAAGPHRPFFQTVFFTLGRFGEVARLRWADLDWERQEIRLWTRKRQGGQLEEDWLPLPPELAATLRQLQRRPERHPEYVFINPKTGRPFTQRRRLIQGICRRAGLRPFGFHAIRHLGADWLMNHGQDLRTISRFLRHKSLRTTERYLKRRPDEALKQAARTLQKRKPLTHPLMKLSGENGSED
jgi:integrase